MNNFLDNLAERALNAEQGVRPRLPSRFEPAAPASEPAWPEKEEPVGVEPFEVTLEQEAGDPSPAPRFSPGQSRESKRESQSSEQSDLPLAVDRKLSPAHQVFQPDTHSLLAPDQLSEAAPGAGFEQALPKPAMGPLRPELAPAVDRREAMVEEKAARQIVNKTLLRPALQSQSATDNGQREPVFRPDTHSLLVSDQLSEAALGAGFEQASPRPAMAPFRPKLAPAIGRREAMVEEKVVRQIVNKAVLLNASSDEAPAAEAARDEASAPLVVRPKLDRYAEPPMPRAQMGSQTQSAPPSEQVINVTIGRIEVRATPPPSAAPRTSNQKPPVMSLDDYLRQRSGRGGGV